MKMKEMSHAARTLSVYGFLAGTLITGICLVENSHQYSYNYNKPRRLVIEETLNSKISLKNISSSLLEQVENLEREKEQILSSANYKEEERVYHSQRKKKAVLGTSLAVLSATGVLAYSKRFIFS